MRLLSFLLFLRLAVADCILVSGDQIHVSDLARALPQFARIATDDTIGYTPAPGIQRSFSREYLKRIALRYGIPSDGIDDVCFQLETEVLTPERVTIAIRTAVSDDRISIELLEFSRYPVPKGQLEFRRSGVSFTTSDSPDVPVLWRGVIKTEDGRSTSVWARVRLATNSERIIATTAIPRGQIITEDCIRTETARAFAFERRLPTKLADIVGHVSRISIPAGQILTSQSVQPKTDINRGDSVHITVASATARLSFLAQAESSASVGGSFTVRNPWNKQTFRAIAEGLGKGRVEVRQ